jgi:hypothetical protein
VRNRFIEEHVRLCRWWLDERGAWSAAAAGLWLSHVAPFRLSEEIVSGRVAGPRSVYEVFWPWGSKASWTWSK